MTTPRLRLLATALVAIVALSACAVDEDGPLVVLAASSLVDVTADLAAAWGESEVLVSDAGSQIIAAQLRGGADADLVLLADEALAAELTREGITLDEPASVATNTLTIVVSPDAADRVDDLSDLAQRDVRLVLADAGVPLGDATRAGLRLAAAAGLIESEDAILSNARSFESAARIVLAKVASHEADAAVVYTTDALAAPDRVLTVAWPSAADVRVTYSAQRVRGARTGAGSFLRFLSSDAAGGIWRDHGFAP